MPLPNILEFIGTNITQRKYQQAQEKLLNYLGVEVPTKTELNSEISKLNNAITPKADKIYVDSALSSFQNGALKTYPTLAAANADIANITLNTKVEVLSATEGGSYYKATAGATTLTKSPYDPLTQAKADATTKANAAEANAVNLLNDAINFNKNSLLLTPSDFVAGYLKYDGVVQTLAGFSYTQSYIALNDYFEYTAEGSAGSSLGDTGICFYDVNKSFISGVRTSTLTNGIKLTPPENAVYVRFGIKSDSTSLFNVRVSSKTIKNIESNLRNPMIYQSASSTQNLENRNPNNITTANNSGAAAIIQFAKQDFPFFLDSCEILMPANGKADIYLYKINSITSITKLKKVGSVSNNSSAIANVSFNFERDLFVPKGYFLAYQATSGGFLYTTNSAQGTSFASLYKATAIPDLNGDAAVLSVDWSSSFYLPLKYTYTPIQYSTMDNLVADLADIRSDIDDVEAGVVSVQKKHEYISVYHDNFKQSALQSNWEDVGSSWQFDFDKGEVKPTAIGGSSYSGGTVRTNTLRLKSTYNANKRSAMMRVSFTANTVLELATTSQFTTGMRIFRIDFANALLQEYSINGTTLLASTPITIPLVSGKQYIVRLDVDRLQERFQIMDYITGQSSTLIKNSTSSGDIQLAHYTLALKSGSPFTMYEFDVSVKNKPKVYIVGDSITAQVASGVNGWAYRFTDLLQGNVVISAQGSTNGFNVPLLIESEAKHIKPDILLWCHGHNGGVTQANLDNVKALCEQYGIKMYVNHVTCSGANNHLAINELIEKNGFKGARFDIATARDNNPYPVEGDSAIRADSSLYRDVSIHPNAAGNQKMFERLAIDLPELFY